MRRARDVRDQLEGLMDRIEVEVVSSPGENLPIRKVSDAGRSTLTYKDGLQRKTRTHTHTNSSPN